MKDELKEPATERTRPIWRAPCSEGTDGRHSPGWTCDLHYKGLQYRRCFLCGQSSEAYRAPP